MYEIAVRLPTLLSTLTGLDRTVQVSGATLGDALADLVRRYPQLSVHLFDESGAFREHVLCFVNDTNSRWLESLDHRLREGDVITVLQAVSGG